MQELAGENSLNPEQRAEIKSLVSQTRLLRQKLKNSSSGSLPLYHQKQLQVPGSGLMRSKIPCRPGR